MRRWTMLFSFLVLGLLLFAGPARAEFDQTIQETYPLSPTGTFSLSNVNGSVRVQGWERDAVEIVAVKTSRGSPTDVYRVNIDVNATPDSVEVVTRYPEGEGVEVSVDYTVRVPYRCTLTHLSTVNGELAVQGMESRGELRSVNGNLKLLDSAGQFNLRTINGNVHIEPAHLDRHSELDVETVNGAVLLALAAGVDADLDVRSMNGEFRSELPIAAGASVAREFHGRLGRGGSRIRIRTMNGAIQLLSSQPVL